MPPKIPDRWIPYKACGEVIEGTRFICFKVPLSRNVQTDPEITKIWDISTVLEEIPKLGAVIDLTNTARYYNPRDFVTAGVMHRKILMPGREIPSQVKVKEFMDAVDEFLGKDCDSLIGVHCTHGLNRTGYMVCRYMRDRLNIPATDAIERFEKARGYQIEREIYLSSLLGRKLPRPDFGKETVIKPINKENDVKSSTYAYNRYDIESNTGRYESSNRHSNDRYGNSNKYGRYSNDKCGSRYNYVKNNDDRSEENGYLSWRNRGEGSSQYSHRRSYRSDDTDSSNRSTPERSGYSYKHDY